jgi:hypothetical protein
LDLAKTMVAVESTHEGASAIAPQGNIKAVPVRAFVGRRSGLAGRMAATEWMESVPPVSIWDALVPNYNERRML